MTRIIKAMITTMISIAPSDDDAAEIEEESTCNSKMKSTKSAPKYGKHGQLV
jgi:hypothetical protein